MRIHPLCWALLLICALPGCATVSGKPAPISSEAARYDDAGIKTGICALLLNQAPAKANDVSVHCFNGHVFLIGEADTGFRTKALALAEESESVVRVTSHWFPTGTATATQDAVIEAEITANPLFAENIRGRKIAVDVWGGHVVLTGITENSTEIGTFVSRAKTVPGVKSVTSYLTIE